MAGFGIVRVRSSAPVAAPGPTRYDEPVSAYGVGKIRAGAAPAALPASLPPHSGRFVNDMGGRGNVAATRVFGLFGMLAAAVAAAAVIWAPAEARAQTRPVAASGCKAEVFATGAVATVMDGRSFTLDDGREIRLAGIEVPLPPAPGETGTAAEAGVAASQAASQAASHAASHAALAALASMVAGQNVELRQTRDATPDRYGRIPAFAYVKRDGVPLSVANEMLARGFARVAAQVGGGVGGDKACAAELLGKERLARDGKLGLWGAAYYAVTGAESLAELGLSGADSQWSKARCCRSARAEAQFM
jgi:endonuclease YncB( thermonuclease family)